MTYPYNMGTYPQGTMPMVNAYPNNLQDQGMQPQAYPYNNTYPVGTTTTSRGPSALAMTGVGAVGGGAIGYFRNNSPINKDGKVADSFAKLVFNKNMKKNGTDESKKVFKELKNVLSKLSKAKTPEKFKKLVNKNKAILEDQCKGISSQAFLDAINSTNLSDSKKALQEALESKFNFEILKTKNAIAKLWNRDEKKFIKPTDFNDEKLFNVIKKVKGSFQLKQASKYAAISGGILGGLTLAYKYVASKFLGQ